MVRAFTVGYPPAYKKAIRIPGNGKAPSGAAFRTHEDAVAFIRGGKHGDATNLAAYEMELPKPYDECVTRDVRAAFMALHIFHQIERSQDKMAGCPICEAHALPEGDYPTDLLLVPTLFINPKTGEPA
jgi:hypothetical protein